MRHKLRLFSLILIAVFIFSFTACYTYTLPNGATDKTTTADGTIRNTTETATTAEAETSEPVNTLPETTIPETIATSETTVQSSIEYNIGDTGPAGGLIFYVNPNYEADGWKYLEAAPDDFPGDDNYGWVQWFNGNNVDSGVITNATGTALGTGMSNTQKIVDIQGNGNYAAKLCSDLTQGGYSDWFLPSKDELNLMFKNLYLKDIGSFHPYTYWSSSEYDAVSAWFLLFDSNPLYSIYGKGWSLHVRAVRAF